jgi:hypothetical protein
VYLCDNEEFSGLPGVLPPGQLTIPLEDYRDWYQRKASLHCNGRRIVKGQMGFIPGDEPHGELSYEVMPNVPHKWHPALRVNMYE